MMESIFSFLPSYFSIIFLAKGKISKSISLFLSHIGPKQCWPIRLQDFKSNISLEQSDEIVCFFTCWYQKLRVDRKILGWLWSEVVVATLVTRWMDEWIELIFCMLIHGVRKDKSYFRYALGQIWLWPFRPRDSKICFISSKNKSMNWADFLHPGGDVIVFGWTTNQTLYLLLLNTGAPL